MTSTSRGWQFPHCEACQFHLKTYGSGAGPSAICFVLGIVFAFVAHWSLFFIGIVAAVAVVVNAHARGEKERKPSCTTASVPVSFIGWSGTIQQFQFASKEYGVAFLAMNVQKAVNLTHEHRAALASPAQRIVSVKVVEAPPAELAESALARWVVKLEAQKGPAGRRAVLAEALAHVRDAKAKQQLMLEASRIEVEAVLTKVDGLKTPAAKKRNLQVALDALRNDPVPDDLQLQQIAWLEDALRDVV